MLVYQGMMDSSGNGTFHRTENMPSPTLAAKSFLLLSCVPYKFP